VQALDALSIPHDPGELPMRGSEDFGLFGKGARSAMFFLGAGVDHPMLHNPDYDFPDALIAPGVAVFHRVLRQVLG
jgi:metal-dependent amidase/aminoacylase/carboxypeptidase family protein